MRVCINAGAVQAKVERRNMYHGMLTVYKEAGYTSSDAVARLRGILRMRKIGHTGTLDPDAEGVLPMCLGSATRICELIADREKEYLAVMRLGVRTDTQDMSGKVLSRLEDGDVLRLLCGKEDFQENAFHENAFRKDASRKDALRKDAFQEEAFQEQAPRDSGPSAEKEIGRETLPASAKRRIQAAAAGFTGEIEQIPPMYSAVKVNGKRLYDLARKGRTVERKARRVTIHSLEIEKVELPLVTMRVRCSKGTYIRTLCEDMGEALGTGAAMQSLLRTRVGQFGLEEARTLDEIERIAKTEPEQALRALIRPVDSFFGDLAAAACSGEALRLLKNGNPLTDADLKLLEKGNPLADADLKLLEKGNSPADADLKLLEKGNPLADAEVMLSEGGNRQGAAPLFLPGVGPQDTVIRVYDEEGRFFGLYKKEKGSRRFTAYKMFLPDPV